MPLEQNAPFNPEDLEQRHERLHVFSHALKNRLGSIWQAAVMLAGLPEGPDRDEVLAMAEKNYFTGARELERLMDDFEVPRGVGRIRRQAIDPKQLLERCVELVDFRTSRKEQEIRLRAMDLPTTVEGDPQVLEQLFEALLSNASKFSPHGAVIELDASMDQGRLVVLVRDHGVGLSPADLEEVFVRYAMLGSRSTDGESQARSTLARARQWAEAHGGSLSATSQGPGSGSLFTVVLPLAGAA